MLINGRPVTPEELVELCQGRLHVLKKERLERAQLAEHIGHTRVLALRLPDFTPILRQVRKEGNIDGVH